MFSRTYRKFQPKYLSSRSARFGPVLKLKPPLATEPELAAAAAELAAVDTAAVAADTAAVTAAVASTER